MAIAYDSEDYISVIACSDRASRVCVIDQISFALYKKYFERPMTEPLVFHFTGMKHRWPNHWVHIAKDEWESCYGKVKYP